jgi:large subunit ribosomal protein L18
VSRVREQRIKRHRRVRKKVQGSAERPRLAVFRSNRHIYAQLIDDISGVTLASASTRDSGVAPEGSGNSIQTAAEVGRLVAERAMDKGVKVAVFDRGGFAFHGKVKALADGARKGGLDF